MRLNSAHSMSWWALTDALSNPRGVLIEARVDPSGYQKQFDAIREL